MNIIAVDDERYALLDLKQAIESALPDATISCHSTPEDALEYAGRNSVSIAFLDIEMDDMNGIELAKRLKDINGKTNIVFVTGYSKYALDSYSVNASRYLMKPVTKKAIIDALEHLRNPYIMQPDKKVRIHTFGNFEVFVDDKPVVFSRARSKEVLAYLIDRKGAGVSKKELAAILWEDEEYTRSKKNQLQVFVSDLVKDLKKLNADNIIINNPNSLSVDITKFECDYYGFNTGNANDINHYTGEYMAQYSWGEFTIGGLHSPK